MVYELGEKHDVSTRRIELVRTLDKTHTLLSYVDGSLKNVTVTNRKDNYQGFIFSLLNPPVPLGGNIVSLNPLSLNPNSEEINIAFKSWTICFENLSANRLNYSGLVFLICDHDPIMKKYDP